MATTVTLRAPEQDLARRRGRPLKEPEPTADIGAEEIERLRDVASRLAQVAPEAMSDAELQDVIVWQFAGGPRQWKACREMIATSRALWLEARGSKDGHATWRRSLADICRRGRGQEQPE